MTISTLILPVLWAGFAFFAVKRLLTYLHIFQQEEYDSRRFFHWMVHGRVFDRRVSLTLVFLSIFFFSPIILTVMLFGIFIAAGYYEKDPRKTGKKKLALTARARRIFGLALGLEFLAAIPLSLALPDTIGFLLAVQLLPFMLMAANALWAPYEAMTQKKYWNEAHEKLLALKPVTIGITGSFGKTSVKHILGHILQTAAPSLITPGSVNTPMGIARIVREQLDKRHKYFLCEMGAYGPGSIARLCDLAPPSYGLITAIGAAHYERFKSLETVAAAKFELAEAVQKAEGGKMIVQADTLAYDKPQSLLAAHPDLFVTAPVPENIEQTPDGLRVTLTWEGQSYTLEAPLYGQHHGANMALAFSASCTLGLSPSHVMTALKSVPQIAHRLEVKPQPGNRLLIDDAYNANPQGFESALNLLSLLAKEKGGRAILVTPGMVELGESHEAEHARLGALAAEKSDLVLVVHPDRIPSFVEAFEDEAFLIKCKDFATAQRWMDDNLEDNDVVLLENDLPDLYETKITL